jgi:hypothetical protein
MLTICRVHEGNPRPHYYNNALDYYTLNIKKKLDLQRVRPPPQHYIKKKTSRRPRKPLNPSPILTQRPHIVDLLRCIKLLHVVDHSDHKYELHITVKLIELCFNLAVYTS